MGNRRQSPVDTGETVIGEAGPEAVIPLDGRHGFGGDIYVTLNVPPTANPVATGREVQKVLDAYRRAGGTGVAL